MKCKWKNGLPKYLNPGCFYFIRDRYAEIQHVWNDSFFVLECLKDNQWRSRLYDDEHEDMTDVFEWENPEHYEYCEIELCN